jgi:hypothetical protein
MSSPFNAGRDSNAGKGTSFDGEADVNDSHAGAMTAEAMHVAGNKLNEEDYRP